MRRLRGVLACAMVGMWCGWAVGQEVRPGEYPPEVKKTIEGNNAFAFELYGRLKGQEGNLFLSPYSISTALGMTYAGARGETEAQMAKAMHFDVGQEKLHEAFSGIIKDMNQRSKGYELSVANALWAQKGYEFRKEYFDLVMKNYGAGLENLNFAGATEEARKTINAWVEKQTKDKIKELLKPGILDQQTVLVLTNAIYFKGDWVTQFDKKLTKDERFLFGSEETERRMPRMVPMMHRTGDFNYAQVEGCQVLEIPYKGNDLSMLVFLPADVTGLSKLEEKLTEANVTEWVKAMQKQEVEVALPKFKVTSEFRLDEALKAMGMTDAFTDKADFSGMTGTRDLFIGAVIHKAYVDVNEEGTEAAAATAVIMEKAAARMPLVFRADHPFVFLIRDKRTGSILFIGRVVNPTIG